MKSPSFAKLLRGFPLVLMLISVLLLSSCRVNQPVTEVPIRTEVRVIEKLVPVTIPADSSSLQALFKCDSTNQVIMTLLGQSQTANMSQSFQFNNGVLDLNSKIPPKIIYLPSKDSIIYQDRPIKVPYPVTTNVLYWWQTTLMWLGVVFIILVVIAVFKRIKNLSWNI